MTPHANVKPLTHWLIYKGYTVRFTRRAPAAVAGVLTTPDGDEVDFTYAPDTRTVHLPGQTIYLNEYGWEATRGAPPAADA
jgi:hypothetical protein